MDGDVATDVRDVTVTAADVLAAQARLRRYLPATPLHHAERFGCWLKLENLQRTGSYKVRGALNALLAARERGDHRTVIAASAGNHAQGLAWAAYRLGLNAITVYAGTWLLFCVLMALGVLQWLNQHLFAQQLAPLVGPEAASFAFAVAFLAPWCLLAVWARRRGWRITI